MNTTSVISFMYINFEPIIISVIVIVAILYFFRDKFISKENKNDKP